MSNEGLSAAYLSDQIGEKGEVPVWVTYVPPERLRLLLKSEEAIRRYTNRSPEEVESFQETLKTVKSEAINQAVRNGEQERISAIQGLSDNSIDATGYDMLLNKVEPAAQTILIKGAKGTGKSTKASDLVMKALDEGIIEKLMTNLQLSGFEDDKFQEEGYDVRYSEVISDYLEFAKEPGEKLMLLDELSTIANMLGSSQEAQDIFPRVINALRKSKGGSCRIIAIGHEHDTDILPSIRNNADGVLEAPNKAGEGIDRAVYYQSFNDYQNENPDFKVRGLQDISDHELFGFDDKTFATLEFNLDKPDEQIQRGRIIDDWEKYQEKEHDIEGSDELAFCSDDDCGSTSQQYPELLRDGVEYCPYHRPDDKEIPDEEPEEESQVPDDVDTEDVVQEALENVEEEDDEDDVPEFDATGEDKSDDEMPSFREEDFRDGDVPDVDHDDEYKF